MTTDTPKRDREGTASRRAFIGRAAAGGLAGAAAVAGGGVSAATTPADAPVASDDDAKRYRESAHVSRYYSLARF